MLALMEVMCDNYVYILSKNDCRYMEGVQKNTPFSLQLLKLHLGRVGLSAEILPSFAEVGKRVIDGRDLATHTRHIPKTSIGQIHGGWPSTMAKGCLRFRSNK